MKSYGSMIINVVLCVLLLGLAFYLGGRKEVEGAILAFVALALGLFLVNH